MLRDRTKVAIRNVYCTDKDDLVIPWSCPCCKSCWLFVQGRKQGSCPFSGPFKGWIESCSRVSAPPLGG